MATEQPPPQELTRGFQELVVLDAKGQATKEEMAALRQPENLDSWYNALIDKVKDLDAQFQERKSRFLDMRECYRRGERTFEEHRHETGRYSAWKSVTIRLKRKFEQRIREARQLRKQRHLSEVDKEKQAFYDKTKQLCHWAAEHIPVTCTLWHAEYQRLFGEKAYPKRRTRRKHDF